MSENRCWSCRRDMAGMAVCGHCGAHPSEKPSLMSKQNPGRLDFRAILMVLASPVLFIFGISEAVKGEDATNGYIAIGAALLFMLFGGLHLFSRYAGHDQ